jgi:hypothetical protein
MFSINNAIGDLVLVCALCGPRVAMSLICRRFIGAGLSGRNTISLLSCQLCSMSRFLVDNSATLLVPRTNAYFAVSTILGLYSSARQSNASELGQNAAFVNFGKASFTISLVFNIVVTLLIAGRLFAMIKQTQQFLPRSHARQYWNTIALITESGAIFTATQLAFIILWNLQLSTSSLALPLAQVYVSFDLPCKRENITQRNL